MALFPAAAKGPRRGTWYLLVPLRSTYQRHVEGHEDKWLQRASAQMDGAVEDA